MQKINLLIITFFFLNSCGGLGDAAKVLRNEKVKTTDEFLVKKKEPLVLPPDYGKLPMPDSNLSKKDQTKDEIEIEKLVSGENVKVIKKLDENSKPTTIEKSILEKIK